MSEVQATIEDWREIGSLFGMEISNAATRMVAEKKSSKQINEHIRAMIEFKDAQLRGEGVCGSDEEISVFMRSAGETAARTVLIAELFGSLNRRQRRALRASDKSSVNESLR
jgi:hypothetical protein